MSKYSQMNFAYRYIDIDTLTYLCCIFKERKNIAIHITQAAIPLIHPITPNHTSVSLLDTQLILLPSFERFTHPIVTHLATLLSALTFIITTIDTYSNYCSHICNVNERQWF